uniref:Uncharacterized protein n=1 Tax=Avena sativa TaxID=4498 RepID=A0ACD6A201_AVESA
MPGLLAMKSMGNINRLFSMWLLTRLDPSSMRLDLGGGEYLEITDKSIGRALGISSSGEVIPMGQPAHRDELLVMTHELLGTSLSRCNNVPVRKLKEMIQAAKEHELGEPEKLQQMAAYTMVAGASFLLPRGSTQKVPDELLQVIFPPLGICKYNMARLVLEGLRAGARKVRETLPLRPRDIHIDGCLISLQILFLDRMEHGEDGMQLLPVPRIEHYGEALLKKQIRKHSPRTYDFGVPVEGQEMNGTIADTHTPIAISAATPSWGGTGVWEEGSSGAAGGGVSTRVPDKIVQAARAILLIQAEKVAGRDAETDAKITAAHRRLDEAHDRFFAEMKQTRDVNRKRALEETLDFVLTGLGKRHAASGNSQEWWQITEEFLVSLHTTANSTAPLEQDAAATMAAMAGSSQVVQAATTISVMASAPASTGLEMGFQDKFVVDNKGKTVMPESSSRQNSRFHSTATLTGVSRGIVIRDNPGEPAVIQGGLDGIGLANPAVRAAGEVTGQSVQTRLAKYTPIRNKRLQLPQIVEDVVMHESGTEATEPVVPENTADGDEFGYSPFELELRHKKHSDGICLDFYETVMSISSEFLKGTWFKHNNPTPISMDGRKLRVNFDVNDIMMYTGLSACIRMFDEKEKEMMSKFLDSTFWRCFAGLELALHFTTTMDIAGQQEVLSMFITAIKGYEVGKCRMIMVPLPLLGSYCLYVYDRLKKRINVLDPVLTLQDEEVYKDKHEDTAMKLLRAIKIIGLTLDDGWTMNYSEWSIRYHYDLHLPCEKCESVGYILHYAEHFDGGDLDVPIPPGGLKII